MLLFFSCVLPQTSFSIIHFMPELPIITGGGPFCRRGGALVGMWMFFSSLTGRYVDISLFGCLMSHFLATTSLVGKVSPSQGEVPSIGAEGTFRGKGRYPTGHSTIACRSNCI